MKKEIGGAEIELEPNSRPYLLKRMLADGFDIVVIFALFMLFTMLIMKIPLSNTYHMHYEKCLAIQKETAVQFQNDAEAVSSALSSNYEFQNELFAANLHGYILKALAAFLSEALILLLIPFLNRDRATPGKLLSGIVPFNERRQTKAVWYQVVCRFLFIFLIDSLGLYLLTGILTFLLVPVLRLIEILLNKKHKTICDYITGVMMIEKLSYDGIDSI